MLGAKYKEELLVLDLETTSLDPWAGVIVEVGIVRIKKDGIKSVYHAIVRPENPDLIDRAAWVFKNTSLTYEHVLQNGKVDSQWIPEVKEILKGASVTAWNNPFDFEWLDFYGIKDFAKCPDPMRMLTETIGLTGTHGGGYKWPKFQEAWDHFKPESTYVEEHRAFSDAYHEAILIRELIIDGHYEF